MKGKNFNKEPESFFCIDLPNQNEECRSNENKDLTAEKVFFN